MNDILRRYLAENEVITIHALDKTGPKIAPQTQYMPGNTEAIITHLKTLLRTRDMDSMRQYAQIAAEDGAFGPPDGFIMTDEFAFEFTKTILSYYQITTHRAEGDYAFERAILPPETTPSPATQTEAASSPLLTLSEAIAAFAKDRRDSKYWTERSAHDILSTLEYLPDILGDIPLPQVDRAAMKEVKSTLLQLPPNRKKLKAY